MRDGVSLGPSQSWQQDLLSPCMCGVVLGGVGMGEGGLIPPDLRRAPGGRLNDPGNLPKAYKKRKRGL